MIGISYFLSLFLFDLDTVGITSVRLSIFTFFQILQGILVLTIFIRWFYECYEINDREIISHRGVIAKNIACYSLERVESVKIKQGFLGALFKFGTLEVSINHSDHRDIVFVKNISHPRRHARVIEKVLKKF